MKSINIFQYLEKTKGKPIPLEYKLINNLPLTKKDLFINGDLLLFRTNITYLPDNLTVKGSIYLCNSKIKVLPNNLTINGSLNINSTKISTLPDDLYVKGNLWCINTPLAHNIKNVVYLLNYYSKQVKGKIVW